jgi:hypothetical protein
MNFKDLFKRMVPSNGDTPGAPRTATQERHAKYGYAEVPAERIYACFNEIVRLDTEGFALVQKGLFGRTCNEQITHLVKFAAGKGGIYGFRWGVSLSFVPHEWDPKRKFHRTLKSARFDLFEDPGEFLVQNQFSDEPWKYMASALHGEECFREELERAWENLEPVLKRWFASAVSLDWVLAKAMEHVNRDWKSLRHDPDPKLVYAFTLAKMRRLPEGKATLSELVLSNPQSYDSKELCNALEEVASPAT